MIEAIDHVEVVTNNIEKSLNFYVETIGFQILRRHKFDGSRGMTEIVYLKLGDSTLELLEFPEASVIKEEGIRIAGHRGGVAAHNN